MAHMKSLTINLNQNHLSPKTVNKCYKLLIQDNNIMVCVLRLQSTDPDVDEKKWQREILNK